ncbi:MAG: hypothetical protein J5855_10265 [Mailhella sp.]|nr:hypothetical protein [Mailhella sp.]
MVPFFQGKIDNFCAIYAVINAVHLRSPLSAAQARGMFNDAVMHAAHDERILSDVLAHATDYASLVRYMLDRFAREYAFSWEPFLGGAICPGEQAAHLLPHHADAGKKELHACGTPEDLAAFFRRHTDGRKGKSVVFRFCRFKPGEGKMFIDHWSTAAEVSGDSVCLFDCSLERNGLYSLPLDRLHVGPAGTVPPLGKCGDAAWIPPASEHGEECIVVPEDCVFAIRPEASVCGFFKTMNGGRWKAERPVLRSPEDFPRGTE